MVVKSVTADLEEIREAMRKAKADERPNRITSLRQAVSMLLPEIEDLRKAKWSDAEIAEWMGKRGLNISAGTLAQYVRESRKLPAERHPERSGVRSAGMTRERAAAPARRDAEAKSERKADAASVHGTEAIPDATTGVPPNTAPNVAPNVKADAGNNVTPNAKAASTTRRRVNDDA